MYNNNKRLLITFLKTGITLGLLSSYINTIPMAEAQIGQKEHYLNMQENQDSDEGQDNSSGSLSIPFNNSAITPSLSKIKQQGYVTHNIIIYKKPDLNNIYFQTDIKLKLGEEKIVYTTELNRLSTTKEENLNLNQDGKNSYSRNNFIPNSIKPYNHHELKTKFINSSFRKIDDNNASADSILSFDGNANVLNNVNVEQEKTAYQISLYSEKESNEKNSNMHSIFNISSLQAIDKKTQSSNSNSAPSTTQSQEHTDNSASSSHADKDNNNGASSTKDSHISLDVKKSPTVILFQRSYETFSLNKKTAIFSTDDFVIHDTATLD